MIQTSDFYRSRIDAKIHQSDPLGVLATRVPWDRIASALAPMGAHKDRAGQTNAHVDLFGPDLAMAGAGRSSAGRLRLPIQLMARGGYAHAKHFNRLKRVPKRQRTILRVVMREVQRKCAAPEFTIDRPTALTELKKWLERAERIRTQQRHDKNKLYALHTPEVECSGKGKARKLYGFGIKKAVVVSCQQGLMLGARTFPGNPFDGHILSAVPEQGTNLAQDMGVTIKQVVGDLGLRGKAVDADNRGVQTVRRRRYVERFVVMFLISLPFFAHAKEYVVPDVGSTWQWQMQRRIFESVDLLIGGPKLVVVSRMQNGRPVFSAELAGRALELFEHADGVAVVDEQCAELFVSLPPVLPPNHCGWNPCTVKEGETISRKLYVVTTYMQCRSGVLGSASYRGAERKPLMVLGRLVEVTRVEASINIPGWGSAKWNPHIEDGLGEVYSQGAGGREETVYTSIVVSSRAVTFDGETPGVALRLENEAPRETVQFACPMRKEGEYLVVAFGDSLTAGSDSSYPEELERQSARDGIRVVNAGVPGDTTEKLFARVESVLACKPNAVLLAVGANDIFQGIPQEDFQTALKALILKLRLGGTDVILLGLEVDEKFPYAGSYERVATSLRVPLIHNMLRGVYKTPTMLLEDGIHPNRKGNVLIASQVAQFLALYLESSFNSRSY